MVDGEVTQGHTPARIRWAYPVVNVILVGVILGTIAFWSAGRLSWRPNSPAALTFRYTVTCALIAAACLVLMLLAHGVAARTAAVLKWPSVLFVLTYLVLQASGVPMARLTGSDIVRVQVVNESGKSIQYLDLFGRGDQVRLDNIPTGGSTVAVFRGRERDDRARDRYSNRVGVSWHIDGRWRERMLVGEAVRIGERMTIVFPAADSVLIAERH